MGRSRWIVAVCAILALTACGRKAPLLVGLIGDLPNGERVADSGFRNGAYLAVAEINDKGGVNGQSLEVAVEDDNGDPGLVPRLDEELIAKGVVAIVGHNTSATTAVAVPIVTSHRVLLMGPEATSSQFGGRLDYFARNEVQENVFAEALANYAVQTLHLRSVGAILDESNTPFSRPFFEAFSTKMKTLGASAEVLYAYQRANAEEMARQVAAFLARGGQSVLLVTGGEDTRNLAQVVRRIQNNVPLLGTPWAMPPSGVQDLGPLPEGLVFPCTWDPGSKAPAYLAFKKAYENRFGLPVDYHAVHAYEAMKIVALGLDRTKGKPDELPQALSAIGHFDGLQGPIQIDSFGDCQRDVSILKVVSGMPRQAVTTPVR